MATKLQIADVQAQRDLEHAEWCAQDWLTFRTPAGAVMLIPWRCGKKWCPDCLMDWSDSLRSRMLEAVKGKAAMELRHLVFTVPNANAGSLAERTRQLYHSFREWRNQGRRVRMGGWWKDVEGYAWKFETHWSRTGWHPHVHVMAHAPKGINVMRGSDARERWASITATAGAAASMRDGIWITRPTCERSVTAEVAKYAAKPLPLRTTPIPRLAECVNAFHSQRFHGSSGTLALGPAKPPGDGVNEFLGSARAIIARGMDRDAKREQRELSRDLMDEVRGQYKFESEVPPKWRSLYGIHE